MSDDWSRPIGLADMNGTRVDVTFTPADEDGAALIGMHWRTGGAQFHSHPTPGAARQIAAALLDAADEAEEE